MPLQSDALARIADVLTAGDDLLAHLAGLASGRPTPTATAEALARLRLACSQLPLPLVEDGLNQCRAVTRLLEDRHAPAAGYQLDQYVRRLRVRLVEWERDLADGPAILADLGAELCRLLTADATPRAVLVTGLEEVRALVDRLPPPRLKDGRLTLAAVAALMKMGEYRSAAYQLRLFLRRLGNPAPVPADLVPQE